MERILDALQVVQYIQRVIKDRRVLISELLESGSIKSMEDYRFLMGELSSLNVMSQELSNLLEKQEQSDD
jgi:hypothetical protein